MEKFLNNFFGIKNNALEAAYILSQLLDVKISRTTLKKEIEEHPDYPGFLSICDVLTNHGIENLVAKFEPDKFIDLPAPFITQTRGSKNVNNFTVVKEIDKNCVHFYDPEKEKWDQSSMEHFLEKCSGIVLLAESEGDLQEKNYVKKIREEKRRNLVQYLLTFCLPIILIASGVLALFQSGTTAILPLLFSIITLMGSAVTILLLWYEVDQSNSVLQQICSAGKKTNCEAILLSEDAKIFGISWSVIGFIYFTGSLIALLALGITNQQTMLTLSWLNLLAVPYIFYSVYYQWKVAKQWCVLCLVVQSILALQCIFILIGGWHNIIPIRNIPFVFSLQMLTSFGIPFIVASLLFPALRRAQESRRNAMELQRLKHNPEIFNALLEKQKLIVDNPAGLGIVLGNPNAAYKIIKVCNPYCGPCAKAHNPMEELLDNNPDLQLQIIFTATNEAGDKRSSPVKHLLAIAANGNETTIKEALGDWYLEESKDYEKFACKYPMNGELKNQEDKIEDMRNWCNKTEIEFTPTFFVNGHQLPPMYNLTDLKYFLTV